MIFERFWFCFVNPWFLLAQNILLLYILSPPLLVALLSTFGYLFISRFKLLFFLPLGERIEFSHIDGQSINYFRLKIEWKYYIIYLRTYYSMIWLLKRALSIYKRHLLGDVWHELWFVPWEMCYIQNRKENTYNSPGTPESIGDRQFKKSRKMRINDPLFLNFPISLHNLSINNQFGFFEQMARNQNFASISPVLIVCSHLMLFT